MERVQKDAGFLEELSFDLRGPLPSLAELISTSNNLRRLNLDFNSSVFELNPLIDGLHQHQSLTHVHVKCSVAISRQEV